MERQPSTRGSSLSLSSGGSTAFRALWGASAFWAPHLAQRMPHSTGRPGCTALVFTVFNWLTHINWHYSRSGCSLDSLYNNVPLPFQLLCRTQIFNWLHIVSAEQLTEASTAEHIWGLFLNHTRVVFLFVLFFSSPGRIPYVVQLQNQTLRISLVNGCTASQQFTNS